MKKLGNHLCWADLQGPQYKKKIQSWLCSRRKRPSGCKAAWYISTRRTGAGLLYVGYVGSRGAMEQVPEQQLAPKSTHARITLIIYQFFFFLDIHISHKKGRYWIVVNNKTEETLCPSKYCLKAKRCTKKTDLLRTFLFMKPGRQTAISAATSATDDSIHYSLVCPWTLSSSLLYTCMCISTEVF